MKRFLHTAAVAAVLAAPTASLASFVDNRATWAELNETQKVSYAAGTFDALLVSFDDPQSNSAAWGRLDCAKALKLTGDDLAKMIDDSYARDTGNWSMPAAGVLWRKTHRTCLVYINRQRSKIGLPDATAAK